MRTRYTERERERDDVVDASEVVSVAD